MKIGLIGKNITHSYSKIIHDHLGCESYQLYDIQTINDLPSLKLDAFNVTHPYKKDIFKYLKQTDEIAEATNSVNTVIKKDNQLIGYNTDYYGFKSLIEFNQINLNNKNITIIGHGATSKTVAYYLKTKNIKSLNHLVRQVVYDSDIHLKDQEKCKNTNIIINTTPVGMYPHTNDSQLIDFKYFPNCEYAIDVIYNPFRTSFLLEASKNNIKTVNGLYMLLMQAVKMEEIVFNKTFSQDMIQNVYRKLILDNINIVFIGLPLSGKSAVGKSLSHKLNLSFYDSDDLIVDQVGIDIQTIFQTKGEPYFRNIEKDIIDSLNKKRGVVISTGGGVILNENNMKHLKQNGITIYINKDLSQTNYRNDHQRPLLKNKNDLIKLSKERNHLYQQYADIEYLIDKNHPHSIERLIGIIYEYFNC
jgi:shikimate dehydrogenase